MLTESSVKRLIDQKTETKTVDYKETLNWQTSPKDARLGVVKDLLAMANTQDGGQIIFGISDGDYEFVGMPPSDWQSFDQTKVNEFAQRYGGPSFHCQVYKHVIDGKRAVCIDVPEFARDPVICELDANSSVDSAKLLLARGTLYLRTAKASTESVRSAEDMRELLVRALLKRGDDLLRTIEQLIKGKPQSVTEESLAKYAKEIESALVFYSKQQAEFGDLGWWELTAHPATYVPLRVAEIPALAKLIRDSEVSLRGWTFPHTKGGNAQNFSEGTEFFSVGTLGRNAEGYRAYRSGLFVWRGVTWEDALDRRTSKGRRMLGFPSFLWDITEFVLFCKRYYERLDVEAIAIKITLNGTEQRVLIPGSPVISMGTGTDICQEPSVSREEVTKMSELKAAHEDVSQRFVKHFLALFNSEMPSDETLRMFQQKLLNRTF